LRPFPESIKGIIFDHDGTTVDRDRLMVHAPVRLLRDSWGGPPIKTRSLGGPHETDTIRKLALQTSGDHFERALDIYKRCLHANLKMVKVFLGMRDLLERLRKADRPMALVASIPDRSMVQRSA